MIPYRIRRAVWADLPILEQLVVEAVRQLNAPDYTQAQIDSALQHAYGVDAKLIEDGTYFVAEANGRILGCGGWSRRKSLYNGDEAYELPEKDVFLNPLYDAAKIRAMFVHPQAARQGIGRALLLAAENAARQAGFSRLELLATRTGEPLYTAVGFAVQERLDVILPDDTPFAVARMEKEIGYVSRFTHHADTTTFAQKADKLPGRLLFGP
ncbi:MAG: GNAT family N-acetyltransferase [Anaerolineaceae bacterium]|nr:GNAT family N-acetyltransferase [Anaerolineaceae bacterium]